MTTVWHEMGSLFKPRSSSPIRLLPHPENSRPPFTHLGRGKSLLIETTKPLPSPPTGLPADRPPGRETGHEADSNCNGGPGRRRGEAVGSKEPSQGKRCHAENSKEFMLFHSQPKPDRDSNVTSLRRWRPPARRRHPTTNTRKRTQAARGFLLGRKKRGVVSRGPNSTPAMTPLAQILL